MTLTDAQLDEVIGSVHLPRCVAARRLTAADAAAIVPLNDSAQPAVPITSVEAMRELLGLADVAVAIERSGEIVGFVVSIGDDAPYTSENYRFFRERGIDSRYVDRIVISTAERGAGLGAALYELVFAVARLERRREVTCEVNLDPPNPGSLAFHERLGFVSVGTQTTKGGLVTVSLLAAPVAAGGAA